MKSLPAVIFLTGGFFCTNSWKIVNYSRSDIYTTYFFFMLLSVVDSVNFSNVVPSAFKFEERFHYSLRKPGSNNLITMKVKAPAIMRNKRRKSFALQILGLSQLSSSVVAIVES